MKKYLVIFMCLILCACASKPNIEKDVEDVFNDIDIFKVRQNNFTKYINYYLPSDIQEDDAEELSYSFSNNDSEIVLNINVSNIINQKYYKDDVLKDEGFFDQNRLIYVKESTYINPKGQEMAFIYKLYDYGNAYIMHFNSIEVNIYAKASEDKVIFTTRKIYELAKSADINTDELIVAYSTKDVIDYQKQQINLFDNSFPVNGRVEDMIIGNGENVQ